MPITGTQTDGRQFFRSIAAKILAADSSERSFATSRYPLLSSNGFGKKSRALARLTALLANSGLTSSYSRPRPSELNCLIAAAAEDRR